MTGKTGIEERSAEGDGLPAMPVEVLPSSELKARVLAAVGNRPAPVRRALGRRTIALALVSWLLAFAVFLYAGGPRVTGRPLALILGTAIGTAVAAGVALWAALVPGQSTLGRAHRVVVPVVVAAPAAIFVWKVFWSSQYDGALDAWATRPGFRCLALGLSMGLLPLIAFAMARRGSDPRRPALTGFAAGIAIGCAATLLTDLWCPVAHIPHLLLGHVLPIAMLGGMGAWLGRHVVALRDTPIQ
jgi:hypothetical protein